MRRNFSANQNGGHFRAFALLLCASSPFFLGEKENGRQTDRESKRGEGDGIEDREKC